MFKASSKLILGGNIVTFQIVVNTKFGENVFLIGSMYSLGEWDINKAKRMTWNTGNVWTVDIGFVDESELNSIYFQYKYFIQDENTKSIYWESIENRQIIINSNGNGNNNKNENDNYNDNYNENENENENENNLFIQDKWNVKRLLNK